MADENFSDAAIFISQNSLIIYTWISVKPYSCYIVTKILLLEIN
jgi:hypothetical protein